MPITSDVLDLLYQATNLSFITKQIARAPNAGFIMTCLILAKERVLVLTIGTARRSLENWKSPDRIPMQSEKTITIRDKQHGYRRELVQLNLI